MEYKVLIGIEMHCEISETKTKVFSPSLNSFSREANTNINEIDLAFPGILPLVNKEAVKKALMASIILNCSQPEYLIFERKNYYYPDLPKGYQITQETKPAPIGSYGEFTYECKGEKKKVRINNIHLEEDAASIDHYSSYSCIDYNRAGVPLLELVTEPDFRSADETIAFLETMRSVYQYAGISEADSKKGQVRCDVNISIMEKGIDETDSKNWGTKVEIKNVNSFGGVRDAINYEIERQIELKGNGTYADMLQQTRRFDEESRTTIFMRDKADAIDYKYFIEPNIPKYKISKEWIEKIKSEIPELGFQRKDRYISNYGFSDYDASVIIKEKVVCDYFEETIKSGANPKLAYNWITSVISGHLNNLNLNINEIFLKPNMLSELIKLVDDGTISIKQGKEVLYKSLTESVNPIEIIEKEGMKQTKDDSLIREFANEVLSENPNAKEQYLGGRSNIVDFLVGQVMKKSRGQANPAMTMQIIKEELDK